MKINIELTESDLKRLILEELRRQLPDAALAENNVLIEVKSKQNYRSEWETASFRARVNK